MNLGRGSDSFCKVFVARLSEKGHANESGKLLAPLIRPLPSYDEAVLGKKSAAGGTHDRVVCLGLPKNRAEIQKT